MHINDAELKIIRDACVLQHPKPIGGLTVRAIIDRLDAAEDYITALEALPDAEFSDSADDAKDGWYASKGEDTP